MIRDASRRLQLGSNPLIGAPRAILGDTPALGRFATIEYSPTTKRFLIAAPIHEDRSAPVLLVTNWAAGLQDR